MAEVIFEGITPYGFMHSSYFTVYAVNFALGLGLESIKNYLESRLQGINHSFMTKTLNGIRRKQAEKAVSMGKYGKI